MTFLLFMFKKFKSRFIEFERNKKFLVKKVRIGNKVSIDSNLFVGPYTYIGDNTIVGPATVSIGSFCSIAAGCVIGPNSHDLSKITTSSIPSLYSSSQNFIKKKCNKSVLYSYNKNKERLNNKWVTIHDDVWLGSQVIIMPGVEIGTGAVVGSGSVVTNNVEPYSVVVGVPAKKLRKRFSDEMVKLLSDSRIYDRDLDKILEIFNKYADLDLEYVIKDIILEVQELPIIKINNIIS